VAPAGTRPQIVATLNSEINNGLKSAEVIASLANLGSEPKIGSPAEFAALIATELQRWSSIAKTALAKVN
jgi:tripartite-type tricarboxylate transporter receptor subunit TctC